MKSALARALSNWDVGGALMLGFGLGVTFWSTWLMINTVRLYQAQTVYPTDIDLSPGEIWSALTFCAFGMVAGLFLLWQFAATGRRRKLWGWVCQR